MKKLVYLISPNKIYKNFYTELDAVLSYGNVKFFQLRLKNIRLKNLILISNKIKKITLKYKVKFIINDDVILANKLNADGCHLGQKDMELSEARKIIHKKIIGITCHNSIKLAKFAIKNNADYIAFGAFNPANNEMFITEEFWKGLPPIVGGWIGGSTSQLVLKELAETPESLFLSVLVLDNILVNIWTILMFQFIKRSNRLNLAWGIDSKFPTAGNGGVVKP